MARTLTIRYTSDTHGYLYPTNYADMQDRPMGLMKLAGEYPHDGNTLIIDGGDTIQGSPLTNLYQRLSPEEKAACLSEDTYGTHPIAAMMNLAGYQFVTLGNHDFNYGVDALMDYLTNLDALCLCANIRDGVVFDMFKKENSNLSSKLPSLEKVMEKFLKKMPE